MMRIIIILFYCIFISNFAYARVDDASISELNPFSYPHLTDTNQSQIFEPMSSIEHFPKLAAVHFIVSDSGQTFDTQENDFADPSGEYCQRYGFTVTSCASGLFNQACPYNDKIYDKCCDAAYTYTSATCSTPKQLSADTCGGKHRCYCDTAAYPYASCNSPQIKGEACTDESGTRYKTCVCPSPATDTGYGCESYYAAPCGSVCSKYYADNCRNRTHNDYGYGCAKYWDDCAAKCERAYTDNCHNHDAVISSCPSNATCYYFADCSTKIQSWDCNSGYKKSGNSCVVADPCAAYYECGGSYQYCAGTTCPQDSSKCSVYCSNNMYPYRCFNNSFCKGRYHRNGYCSEPCATCTRLTDYSIEEELDWGGEYQTDGYCYFLFSDGTEVADYTGVRWTSGSSDGNFRDECNRVCDEYK